MGAKWQRLLDGIKVRATSLNEHASSARRCGGNCKPSISCGCRCLHPRGGADTAEAVPQPEAAVCHEINHTCKVQTHKASHHSRAPIAAAVWDPVVEVPIIILPSGPEHESADHPLNGIERRSDLLFTKAGRPIEAVSTVPSTQIPALMSSLTASEPVILNIYDIGKSDAIKGLNRCLYPWSLGIFHGGIELYGTEWSFGGTEIGMGLGVFCSRPRQCSAHSYLKSAPLGSTRFSMNEVERLISKFQLTWPAADYNLLTRNCCHFCNELCQLLCVGPIPEEVTALAEVGAHIAGAYSNLLGSRLSGKTVDG